MMSLKKVFSRKITWGMLLFFLFGIGSNPVVTRIIPKLYPVRPLVFDLMFDLLPLVGWTQYLSDPLMILGMVFFGWYVLNEGMERIPELLFEFGLIHIVRAMTMLLTPLGRTFTYDAPYGIFQNIVQFGLFPSGHTAVVFLMYFVIEDKFFKLKITLLVLAVLQAWVLLLSRGHYSIDIVGGLMIAYIAHRKGDDYAKVLRISS